MSLELSSILIIDDNEDDRYLLRRMLRKLQIARRVFEADNAETALELLSDPKQAELYPNEFPPALIFLDINMPLRDGFVFLEKFERLRARPDYARTVVLMFTSSNLRSERVRASEFEFVRGEVAKMPPDAETLRVAIERALQS